MDQTCTPSQARRNDGARDLVRDLRGRHGLYLILVKLSPLLSPFLVAHTPKFFNHFIDVPCDGVD